VTVASRRYRAGDDADWLAVRDLLVRTHATSPPCWNWDGDMGPANALYRSIPFTEEYRGHTWRRDLGTVW
jgi:hypothetical protein